MRFTLDFSGQNEGHKKSFLFVCSHGLKIHASSTKKGKPMKKQEIIAAIAYPPAKEAALELAEKAEEAE